MKKNQYSEIRVQIISNDVILDQCCIVVLNAWDKIKQQGKLCESFAMITQDPDESFANFLQILTSALSRPIS